MASINARWDELEQMLIAEGSDTQQLGRAKNSYYAGAMAMRTCMREIERMPISSGERVYLIDDLVTEIAQYAMGQLEDGNDGAG